MIRGSSYVLLKAVGVQAGSCLRGYVQRVSASPLPYILLLEIPDAFPISLGLFSIDTNAAPVRLRILTADGARCRNVAEAPGEVPERGYLPPYCTKSRPCECILPLAIEAVAVRRLEHSYGTLTDRFC